MTDTMRLGPELILEIVRLTDCYPSNEVIVIATDEQIVDICERYNLPEWFYATLIEWSGHALGTVECMDDMKRRSADESRPMTERALAQYAAHIARNWLETCQYARMHDEAVTRPE